MIGRAPPAAGDLAAQLLLSLLFAAITATMLVSLFFANRALVLPLLAGVPLLALFLISSNQRLFCLWGLVLTAPLSLSKVSMPIPHMGGAAAYSIDISDAFLLPLLVFVLHERVRRHGRRLRLSPYFFWSGGLILLGAVNIAFGPARHLASQEVLRTVKCLLIFFVILNEAVRPGQLLHIAAALLVGAGLEAIIGLAQFVLDHNLGLYALGESQAAVIEYGSSQSFGGETFFRVGALLGHPNLFGAYLALLIPIGMALLFGPIRPRLKILLVGVVALGGLALIATLSRSSWLSFGIAFVSLLVLSFVHPNLRRRYLMARLAAILSLAIALMLMSGVIGRRLAESDPGAVNFRWEWMGVAWNMVEEHPLLGFGLNTFIYNLPGRTRFGGVEVLNFEFGSEWPVVHNIYLIIWSEQGTIGFLFFLGLNLYLLRTGFRSLRQTGEDTLFTLAAGCLSGLVAIINDGFASFFLRVPPGGRVFSVVAAMIVAIDCYNRACARPVAMPTALSPLPPERRPIAADRPA
jgi:O-antigen ligase